ncbi:hypothetical protein NQ314_016107 [Rhamnusium bicolor]|uniref:Uncharacterized protein n=1 Tax=Rhamnusium bicolor TaxID=1586634 RepID=A0AAV8WZI1_9CUCU|nr:hypothetical protein NQ314_016107 [Rhamnusium bicolor]
MDNDRIKTKKGEDKWQRRGKVCVQMEGHARSSLYHNEIPSQVYSCKISIRTGNNQTGRGVKIQLQYVKSRS